MEKTCHLDSLEIVVYIDDDDIESHALENENLSITKIIGSRRSMGSYNTACLRRSSGDIVILVNDDMVIRTVRWDERVRALHGEIKDQIYLAYGNDLFKGKSLCAFPIVSRRTCDVLGEPFPADYKGAFIDYHLLDIFKRLQKAGHDRIRYLEDVIFEHMHFRSGKGRLDATYAGRQRFADDDDFIRLRDTRSLSANSLLETIESRAPCGGPRYPAALATKARAGLTQATLLDPELPWSWSLRLYFWFLARLFMRRIQQMKQARIENQ